DWLLANWDVGVGGWSPNPSLRTTESFPGLTAQTLYVLELVSKEKAFSYIQKDATFNTARSTFIKFAAGEIPSQESLWRKDISQNQRLHDSDRYLEGQPYTAEQMTFLWYPWTVAVMNEFRNDSALQTSDQITAAHIFHSLMRRINGYWRFAQRDPVIYPSAE